MNVELREFQPGEEAIFRALNEAWISASFSMEEKDLEILGDPQRHILDPGGSILFAAHAETKEILGCCALLSIGQDTFEVAKMAVAEPWRGQGIGRQLLRGVLATARTRGARRLYLETHHSLQAAIALYRSEGFQFLRPEDIHPSPYRRVTVYMERYL